MGAEAARVALCLWGKHTGGDLRDSAYSASVSLKYLEGKEKEGWKGSEIQGIAQAAPDEHLEGLPMLVPYWFSLVSLSERGLQAPRTMSLPCFP